MRSLVSNNMTHKTDSMAYNITLAHLLQKVG